MTKSQQPIQLTNWNLKKWIPTKERQGERKATNSRDFFLSAPFQSSDIQLVKLTNQNLRKMHASKAGSAGREMHACDDSVLDRCEN